MKINWFKFTGRVFQGLFLGLIVVNLWLLSAAPRKFSTGDNVELTLAAVLLVVIVITVSAVMIFKINDDIKEVEGR